MLLLHSLSEFWPIISGILARSQAKAVAEIGAEQATMTRLLCMWASEHGAEITSIEPFPSPSLRALTEEFTCLHVISERSLSVLRTLPRQDLYLIDGDHNYYTVFNELQLISKVSNEQTIILLHDVGWPCARRDMYYAPDAIPPASIHEYTWHLGVVPSHPGVIHGGFRSEGHYGIAIWEGGSENGVLTAVEDFLSANAEWVFISIPTIFGLGILVSRDAGNHDAIASFLLPYSNNPLMLRLEENRIELYIRVLDLQDQLTASKAECNNLRRELEHIRTTRSWRAVERWWMLKERVIPPGSKRAWLFRLWRKRFVSIRRTK